MKFRLKENPIDVFSPSPLEDYLKSIGISKVSSFISAPSEIDEEAWGSISYIRQGIDMLHKHILNNSKIFLQVDSDTDGYTSSAIIYSFIKDLNPSIEIDYNIHPAKEHGIVLSDITEDYDLIIVPDAGSNQKEMSELADRGSDVLIIDHHIVDVDISSDKIIVVNNQSSPIFSNSSLSGAGMVYKFIQGYSERYLEGNEMYKYYMDLAAIGIVADSMDSRNLDNNYLIYHGLRNIKNKLIKAILDSRAFSVSSVEDPNKIDIAFYIAPVINGLIRFGTMEQKRTFFHALVTKDSEEEFTRISRGKEITETLYEVAARIASSVKTTQDNEIKKVVPLLMKKIEAEGLDKNKIVVCKVSKTNPDEVPKTVTGLVAMRLSAAYNKPVLVLRPTYIGGELHYAGSGRASAADGFDSFKDFLLESNLVTYSSGHAMAFGTSVPDYNIDNLINYANDKLKDVDFGGATVEVDAIFNQVNSNTERLIMSFGAAESIYGNGIPQPKFLYEITVSSSSISVIGKTKSTLKITIGNVSFIKFRAAKEIEDLEQIKTTGVIRIMGRPQINEFNGRTTPQMIADYIEVVESEARLF